MKKIDVVAEATQLEMYWASRNVQIQEDRDIINLAKPIQRTNKTKWISNEPKVFYDTSVSLCSSYQPRFRMPLTINYTDTEKEKTSKAERFCIGIFRSLDARQFRRGQPYWLRELAYWVLSGWYSIFTQILENPDGSSEFVADFFDPMTVYPEWDADGLTKVARVYETDKRTALGMVEGWIANGLTTDWVEPSNDSNIKVVNYWRQERTKKGNEIYNAIYIDGRPVKELQLEKDLKRIPIQVGAVGIPEKGSAGWQSRWGENVIAPNRDMYEYENTMISLMATIMAETAYPNIATYTRTGAPAIKGEDMKGYGEVLPLRLEDKIELLKHAATPMEALQLLQYVSKQRQKGSIPDVAYGNVPTSDVSGFALSQYMAAIKYRIGAYLNTMQYILSYTMSDFLSQYREGDYKPIKLLTTNPKEIKKGMFFVEEFNKSDVPDSLFIEVVIPVTSALDKTQQILFARQAITPPQLLSRETLWDEMLDVQDSEQEYIRIVQDTMMDDPFVRGITLIEQLKERQKLYESQGKMEAAQAMAKYITMKEQELGMGAKPAGGASVPGVPPEQMPPEMGGISPDMKRAMFGTPPPGLNRLPQTPEQRTESKSMAGMPPPI